MGSIGWVSESSYVEQIQGDVDDFLQMLEQRHGVKLPPGRNPDIQFMAHLWEPLRVLPKPLLMYLTSEAMGLATDAALWAMGFKMHRCQVLPCSCLLSMPQDAALLHLHLHLQLHLRVPTHAVDVLPCMMTAHRMQSHVYVPGLQHPPPTKAQSPAHYQASQHAALQGFRYWVRTPTAADLHPQPLVPQASQHKVLPKLRSMTSDLGMEARDVASMAAAALSGYQPVRRGTGKEQAEVHTAGLPLERGGLRENGGADMPPISPWQLEPRPSMGRASRMTGPWDSASSISPGLEAATQSSSPVFFMHGVGLGIVRPPGPVTLCMKMCLACTAGTRAGWT